MNELLAVMAAAAILLAIAIPILNGARDRAEVRELTAQLDTAAPRLVSWIRQNGSVVGMDAAVAGRIQSQFNFVSGPSPGPGEIAVEVLPAKKALVLRACQEHPGDGSKLCASLIEQPFGASPQEPQPVTIRKIYAANPGKAVYAADGSVHGNLQRAGWAVSSRCLANGAKPEDPTPQDGQDGDTTVEACPHTGWPEAPAG